MNCWIRNLSCCLGMTALLALGLPGCTPHKEAKKEEPALKKHYHPTKGPHGGPLAEWGDDEIHVELTINPAAKQMVIYLLDYKAEKAPKIDPGKIAAPEQPERLDRQVRELIAQPRGHLGGIARRCRLVIARAWPPLGIVGHNGPEAGFLLGEKDLGNRQDLQLGRLN